MSQQIDIESIWWRNVPVGEFYNVERHPNVTQGGQGSLYFEIPKSLVDRTLDFLGLPSTGSLPFTIQAGAIGVSAASGPIEFQRKAGGRMRIVRQNRQMAGGQRHPAWKVDRGFPTAPDDVQSKEEAEPYFPDGGLRIYIAKTFDGEFYAGFTTGRRPAAMDKNNPAWDLYTQGRIVGDVIYAG
ncbi:hypothetical protein [Glutamicibacter protophormiae]|uniref:Uncharacterized protein n=1 Tax=Glutamicibacter protophormiae TaxID=37930 RepID=A0ABS4XMW8_GLUPR|nr:hypothetical protein [Glutamicibacter protophormiae]MBP2397617.1 hypothetical protein [Glutamicibacter protophormiae]GGL77732.1 hypothetical protein GCM10010038_04760 [Glutamicibacter protophormiae]